MKPLDWILLGVIGVAVIAALVYWLTHRSCSCGSGSCSGNCANCGMSCKKSTQEPEKKDLTGQEIPAGDKKEIIPEKMGSPDKKETVSFEVLDASMEKEDPEQSRTTEEYTEWLTEQNASDTEIQKTEGSKAAETQDAPSVSDQTLSESAD